MSTFRNWLDTTGATQDCITYRWNQAKKSPVPKLTLVPFDNLNDFIPSSDKRVTAAERNELLRRRRHAALKRFLR